MWYKTVKLNSRLCLPFKRLDGSFAISLFRRICRDIFTMNDWKKSLQQKGP